jgi:hypothetical protein
MAGTTQDKLFEHFRAIAAGSMASTSGPIQSKSDDRVGISGSDTSIPIIGSPLPPATSSRTSSGGGTSGFALASGLIGSGLGLVPLVTGLMGLFSGGTSAPPPLTKYAMPQRLDFMGADTGSGIAEMGYDQVGMPRLSGTAVDSSNGAPSTAASAGGSGNAAAPQISVTVQAMDSQSFMDHSNDIAQAVRQAMLNLGSINDVIGEL